MSKIGKAPIELPAGVTVDITEMAVVVKGSKGQLKTKILPGIKVKQEGNILLVTRKNDERQNKANHGLIRSLIANNVQGVLEGYKKTLKLVGTGYRVTKMGIKSLNPIEFSKRKEGDDGIAVTVGYSHPVEIEAVEGIKLTVEGNDTIHIEGFDKQLVGQVAANIRSIHPPEPYKGKGIRYEDELVRTKPGKTAVG